MADPIYTAFVTHPTHVTVLIIAVVALFGWLFHCATRD